MMDFIKEEAIDRMETLTELHNLDDRIVDELKAGIVLCSGLDENGRGRLGTILKGGKVDRLINSFEKENDAYVYHVIQTKASIGHLITLLFVSEEEEYWDYERPKEEGVFATVYNLDWDCEDTGDIFVGSKNGALYRIA